jgi:hypothetical protein
MRGPSGGEEGLRRAAGQGRHFLDFNTEQQAGICRPQPRRAKMRGFIGFRPLALPAT